MYGRAVQLVEWLMLWPLSNAPWIRFPASVYEMTRSHRVGQEGFLRVLRFPPTKTPQKRPGLVARSTRESLRSCYCMYLDRCEVIKFKVYLCKVILLSSTQIILFYFMKKSSLLVTRTKKLKEYAAREFNKDPIFSGFKYEELCTSNIGNNCYVSFRDISSFHYPILKMLHHTCTTQIN